MFGLCRAHRCAIESNVSYALYFTRTKVCSFSEYKIYPGHGSLFIRKDGQVWLRSAVRDASPSLAYEFHQSQGYSSLPQQEEARSY